MTTQAVAPLAQARRFFADRGWREDRVAAYASVGVMVFLTAFFWAPTRDFMQAVYAASFLVPVLLVLLLRPFDARAYGGWFTGLGLAYGLFAALSTLWSPAPRPFFFLLHFLYLAVWLAGTAWLACRGKIDPLRLRDVLVVTGAVASVLYLAYYSVTIPLGERLELRGYGVARNPNTLGMFFGALSLLAYVRWLDARGRKQACSAFALLILNILPVLVSQSRGPILALAFALALGFALHRGPSRKILVHALGGAVLVAGLTFAVQQPGVVDALKGRWEKPGDRPLIWQTLLERGADEHLLFGRGLEKTSRISMPGLQGPSADVPEGFGPAVHHAHSAYIDAFYRTGLIGLALLAAHLLYVLSHLARSAQLLPWFLWLVFFCLCATVDWPGFFWYLDSIWFGYWIPAGLIGAFVTAGRADSVA